MVNALGNTSSADIDKVLRLGQFVKEKLYGRDADDLI
jgi:hypothetical protein